MQKVAIFSTTTTFIKNREIHLSKSRQSHDRSSMEWCLQHLLELLEQVDHLEEFQWHKHCHWRKKKNFDFNWKSKVQVLFPKKKKLKKILTYYKHWRRRLVCVPLVDKFCLQSNNIQACLFDIRYRNLQESEHICSCCKQSKHYCIESHLNLNLKKLFRREIYRKKLKSKKLTYQVHMHNQVLQLCNLLCKCLRYIFQRHNDQQDH